MKTSKVLLERYSNEDYRNIFRLVKTNTLLNQLYNADSISSEQFQKEEKHTLQKFNRIIQHIGATDLSNFAEVYGIQQQMKRMKAYKKDDIESIAISLTSKIIEILDSIELYRENLRIKQIINSLTDIAILLKKYKSARSNISQDFAELIDKIYSIYEKYKKRAYTDSLQKMEIFQLEDSISKMRNEFYNHAGGAR